MHGAELGSYAYGVWTAVAFNVLLVAAFVISFVTPKTKAEWRSMGAFLGFIVALFTEMYGFPLTIYFLTVWMGTSYPVLDPFSHPSGHLVLVFLGLAHSDAAMAILHIITNGIVFFGFYMMYKGWKLIYESRGQRLVTDEIYSHVRHPQYTGMFLVTIGFLIQWPSISTLVMWPILMYAYYRLSKREEQVMENTFGAQYAEYRRTVPAFLPIGRRGGPAINSKV